MCLSTFSRYGFRRSQLTTRLAISTIALSRLPSSTLLIPGAETPTRTSNVAATTTLRLVPLHLPLRTRIVMCVIIRLQHAATIRNHAPGNPAPHRLKNTTHTILTPSQNPQNRLHLCATSVGGKHLANYLVTTSPAQRNV